MTTRQYDPSKVSIKLGKAGEVASELLSEAYPLATYTQCAPGELQKMTSEGWQIVERYSVNEYAGSDYYNDRPIPRHSEMTYFLLRLSDDEYSTRLASEVSKNEELTKGLEHRQACVEKLGKELENTRELLNCAVTHRDVMCTKEKETRAQNMRMRGELQKIRDALGSEKIAEILGS